MKKGILGGIIGLFVLGAGAGAYFFFQEEITVAQLIGESTELMEAVDTMSFEGTLRIEGVTNAPVPDTSEFIPEMLGEGQKKLEETTEGTLTLAFSGAFNNLIDEEAESFGWIDLNLVAKTNQGDGEVGFEMRMVDEERQYMRLSKLILPETLSSPEIDLITGQLVGSWIDIASEEMDDEDEDDTEDTFDEIFDEDNLENLFAVEITGETMEIRGNKARKILIDPNHDAIRAMILSQYEETHNGEAMLEVDKVEMEKVLQITKDLTAEVWLGTDEAYPYRIGISGPFSYVDEVTGDESSGTIEFSVDLFGFNEPVQAEVPETVLTMEQLMQRVFAAMFTNPAMLESLGTPDSMY